MIEEKVMSDGEFPYSEVAKRSSERVSLFLGQSSRSSDFIPTAITTRLRSWLKVWPQTL